MTSSPCSLSLSTTWVLSLTFTFSPMTLLRAHLSLGKWVSALWSRLVASVWGSIQLITVRPSALNSSSGCVWLMNSRGDT